MGLAASQCRLLMLTARLHDTEFQAQMISERRLALARQTEQIATEYNQKMQNKVLRFVYDYSGNERKTTDEPLTYAGLTEENAYFVGKFRVTLPDGRVAVPSVDQIPAKIVKGTNGDGQQTVAFLKDQAIKDAYLKYVDPSTFDAGYAEALKTNPDLAKDDFVADCIQNMNDEQVEAAYNTLIAAYNDPATHDDVVALGITPASLATDPVPVSDGVTIIGDDGTQYVIMPALSNKEFFQDALQTGALLVEKYNANPKTGGNSWEEYDLLNSPVVEESMYTEDDAAAEAEYRTKSAMIQSQDKLLEIQLKQVETQHQAAQTEYDSVKKVIDKNIERSFKTFG